MMLQPHCFFTIDDFFKKGELKSTNQSLQIFIQKREEL